MAVTFAVTLAFVAWLFSEATLGGPGGVFIPRSGRDAYGFVTLEAMRLARTPATNPRLILIGTSSTAQMAATGDDIARELRASTGRPWRVHVLATPLQSPIDQVALVEAALRSDDSALQPTVIALGFQVQRMGWTAKRYADPRYRDRLGLRSEWADAELRQIGVEPRPRTGIHAIDIAPFTMDKTLVAMGRFATRQAANREADVFAIGDASIGEAKRRASIAGQITDGMASSDLYLGLMDRLAAHISRSPNARLVYFEESMRPSFPAEAGIEPVAERLQARFRKHAAARGIPYWRIGNDAGLTDADFHDALHLKRGNPQARSHAEFVRRVAALS